MKKLFIVLIIMVLLLAESLFIFPEIGGSLDKLSRPSMFLVNHNRVYILERTTVFIYSLKDFKLIRKFGKAGEGPKEFKYREADGKPLSMCIFKNQLLVNSDHKRSFFDLDGNFIKEEKVLVDKLIFPINGKTLGIGPLRGENKKYYLGYSLYEKNYTSEKTVHLTDFEVNNMSKMVLPVTSFTFNPVYKTNIYLNANSEEFKINVYDSEGKIKYVIEKNYPKIKIPKNFRNEVLDFFKKSPRFSRGYELFKKILQVRENFPPIRDLIITDDFIYVLTFKRKGDLWECIKMDLKGNEKGSTFISLNEYEHFTLYPIFYSVYKGKIYSLVEDEEEEIWNIHISEF